MFTAISAILGPIIGKVVGNLFPDPKDELKRANAENAFRSALLEHASKLEKAGTEIVQAEITKGGWLARSWRPITMLVFLGLIVSRWLGYTAPDLSEAEVLELWSLVKIGLGGYVIGRSAEKTLPSLVKALSALKS